MDLVAITESWLHKDIADILISISGYNIHCNDRTGSRGGDVCVYSLQNIPRLYTRSVPSIYRP